MDNKEGPVSMDSINEYGWLMAMFTLKLKWKLLSFRAHQQQYQFY